MVQFDLVKIRELVKKKSKIGAIPQVEEELKELEDQINAYYFPEIEIICSAGSYGVISLSKYFSRENRLLSFRSIYDQKDVEEVCAEIAREILKDSNYTLQIEERYPYRYRAVLRLKKRAKLPTPAKEWHSWAKEAYKEQILKDLELVKNRK